MFFNNTPRRCREGRLPRLDNSAKSGFCQTTPHTPGEHQSGSQIAAGSNHVHPHPSSGKSSTHTHLVLHHDMLGVGRSMVFSLSLCSHVRCACAMPSASGAPLGVYTRISCPAASPHYMGLGFAQGSTNVHGCVGRDAGTKRQTRVRVPVLFPKGCTGSHIHIWPPIRFSQPGSFGASSNPGDIG